MFDFLTRLINVEKKIKCLETNFETESGNIVNTLESGHRIGTYINTAGISKDIFESVTGLALVGQNLVYSKEDGDTDLISLENYLQESRIVSGYVDTIHNKIILVRDDTTTVEIDIATLLGETLTHISTANNVITYENEAHELETIDLKKYYITSTVYNQQTGLVTFTRADNSLFFLDLTTLKNSLAVATITNLLTTGHAIGTFNNGAGQIVTIKESICHFVDNGNGTITMTNEAGSSVIFVATPNFTIGNNTVNTNPNTNGEVVDPKNGDIYYGTDEVMWFYNVLHNHWYIGGGGETALNMYDTLTEAISAEGAGKKFYYSQNNLDGAVAYSIAYTPNNL